MDQMGLKIHRAIPENKKDDLLLNEFRSGGDLAVLAELYGRYMHLVNGVCLKYLKGREEAKDGVMQIFEKLIIEIPRHKIENFRNWLYVVTKNYCLMQLRTDRSKKEKFSEWITDYSLFMETAVDLHPLDKEEDEKLRDDDLEECIERLKELQKQCIRQFYFENKCYNEITILLGIDEKKVKSCLQNGKRNLKLCLEEKNGGKRQK
jgi:RNA polymerase sigma-70 factor (ECF subfamily)